jgi:hypothetical protein
MSEFKLEHNVLTDEIVEIPLTEKEIKELEKVRTAAKSEQAIRDAENAQKAADKAALLSQLGITEDQAKLLIG